MNNIIHSNTIYKILLEETWLLEKSCDTNIAFELFNIENKNKMQLQHYYHYITWIYLYIVIIDHDI